MVLRAGAGSTSALEELCGLYWDPVFAYLRRAGLAEPDARDATQTFFHDLLRRGDLARLTREGGRFRSWLLVAVRRHHQRTRRDAAAAKRAHRRAPPEALERVAAPQNDPEAAYHRQWALSVLDAARRRVRDAYVTKGQEALFDTLYPTLTQDRPGYATLGESLGRSAGATRVAAHRLREHYRDALRDEVRDTVAHGDEVDDELAALMSALGDPTVR